MQPEEKASDCDKPNTLCNRIFHFCKTDKEEKTQQLRVARIWGRWFQRTTPRHSRCLLSAEFLHKYAVKRYDVLLLPENMLWARVGSIWAKRLGSPKEIVSTPHIRQCYWIAWLLTGLTHFLVNTNSILTAAVFFYLPRICLIPPHPLCIPTLSPFSLALLSIDWHNQVETIFFYWARTNYKIKMKCYYKRGKKIVSGVPPQKQDDP